MTPGRTERPGAAEWNAPDYHRLSDPLVAFGDPVLAALELEGRERVLDAGCGTGRLTAGLVARLPRGHVTCLDRSRNMLVEARQTLPSGPTTFVQAALPALPFRQAFDVIFSTATFHWVLDHPALFRALRAALVPGGRLHAQCGGGPNIARFRARVALLMAAEPFAQWFAGWTTPWEFADAETTARRLGAAGFVDVKTSVQEAPVRLADAAQYREYLATVIVRDHLAFLPDPALRRAFLDELTRLAAADPEGFVLDYWRLNLAGRAATSSTSD